MNRIKEMISLVKASGQYDDVRDQISLWEEKGSEAKMIGFHLRRKRIACPSCGMNGASFVACDLCGGPACDNCRNMARNSTCSVCRSEV